MIHPHSLKLAPTNDKARKLTYTLFGLIIVAFLAYMLADQYKGIIGLCVLTLMCAAIFFYTKYVSPIYYYDLTDDSDGVWVFVARQVVGNRTTTLCRISLHEITSVTRESAEERRAHKVPRGTRSYSYLPTLSPSVTWRITTHSSHETAEIVIEAPDEYIAFLERYIAEARALFNVQDVE
jgi:hypothetical protein